jgi:hypothetical protein
VVAKKKTHSSPSKEKHIAAAKRTPSKPHVDGKSGATVTIDRRESHDRRSATDRRVQSIPVAVERRTMERRVKVSRRRQIDPTTCERDYTTEEIEFMGAMDSYKRSSGRMFPTCSEVLEVIKSLGYVKAPFVEMTTLPSIEISTTDVLNTSHTSA